MPSLPNRAWNAVRRLARRVHPFESRIGPEDRRTSHFSVDMVSTVKKGGKRKYRDPVTYEDVGGKKRRTVEGSTRITSILKTRFPHKVEPGTTPETQLYKIPLRVQTDRRKKT